MSNQDTDFDNAGTGALFVNDRKTRDNQPDHRGEITVTCPCCKEVSSFWTSAWRKPMRRNPNQKFFSLAMNTKEAGIKQTDEDGGEAPAPAPAPAPSRAPAARRPVPARHSAKTPPKPTNFDDGLDDDIPF